MVAEMLLASGVETRFFEKAWFLHFLLDNCTKVQYIQGTNEQYHLEHRKFGLCLLLEGAP